jgi:hypothetical protein
MRIPSAIGLLMGHLRQGAGARAGVGAHAGVGAGARAGARLIVGDGVGSGSFAEMMLQGAREDGKTKKKGAEEPAPDAVAPNTMWSPPAVGAPALGTLAQAEPPARRSLEDLLPALVRRIAWSGDARRGTIRLELGAGALSGGTLVVHADEGRVRVQLNAPEGVDAAEWRARIEERLVRRGLSVEAVDVE